MVESSRPVDRNAAAQGVSRPGEVGHTPDPNQFKFDGPDKKGQTRVSYLLDGGKGVLILGARNSHQAWRVEGKTATPMSEQELMSFSRRVVRAYKQAPEVTGVMDDEVLAKYERTLDLIAATCGKTRGDLLIDEANNR